MVSIRVKELLVKLLKLYGIFAVLNSLTKIMMIQRRRLRAKQLWKHLPGKDADPMARRMRNRGVNFHDFFADPGYEHPNAPLIKLDIPAPALLCNSAESVQWMLKDEFDNITKAKGGDYMFTLMRQFLGPKGIFVLRHGNIDPKDHEVWLKERKVASLIFTKSNFETTFYDTFVEKGKRFLTKLEKSNEQIIDLQEMFFSFTMDSIEKFFMGTEVNTIEGGMSEYAKAFDEAHKAMMRMMTSSTPIQILIRQFLPVPFGNLVPTDDITSTWVLRFYRRFLQPDNVIFQNAIKKLDDHVLKYVKETRNDPNLKNRKDIIANFLNSKIGDELDDRMLRDIVLSLTIAGRDTTACALSWMFFQLTQNLDVQQKLIEEIREKLNGKIPTMADLEPSAMPYLNGVIYETLRLHPPVPTESKRVEKEIQYLDGTIVPRHTVVLYSALGLGRNPIRYPDPLKFDPNRWIPFVQPSLYEFPVFQAGPRFCLGKDMAQFEMKLLATMILQKFSFTLVPGEEKKIGYSLMLTQSVANDEKRNSLKLLCVPHKNNI